MGVLRQRFSSACSTPKQQLLRWATLCGSSAHPDPSPLLALWHKKETISGPEHPLLFYSFSFRVVYPYMTVSFETAWRTLQGYEIMNMIRKGQVQGVDKDDVRGQVVLIAHLFGVAA